MRPVLAAFPATLINSVKVLVASSFFFAATAARTFFSTVRTVPRVLLLIAFRRSETRARFAADLWFAKREPPMIQ